MRCTLRGFAVDRHPHRPPASTARTLSPKGLKSADKTEGAMRIDGAARIDEGTPVLSSGIDFCRDVPAMVLDVFKLRSLKT